MGWGKRHGVRDVEWWMEVWGVDEACIYRIFLNLWMLPPKTNAKSEHDSLEPLARPNAEGEGTSIQKGSQKVIGWSPRSNTFCGGHCSTKTEPLWDFFFRETYTLWYYFLWNTQFVEQFEKFVSSDVPFVKYISLVRPFLNKPYPFRDHNWLKYIHSKATFSSKKGIIPVVWLVIRFA